MGLVFGLFIFISSLKLYKQYKQYIYIIHNNLDGPSQDFGLFQKTMGNFN